MDSLEDCWEWAGGRDNGYGCVKFLNKSFLAHRVSYLLFKGKIPKGCVVRHSCDNPLCINPQHLLVGSHADNVKDRVERCRSAKGMDNGRAKIDPKTSNEIQEKLASGRSKTQLAIKYGVDPKVIRNIAKGVHWTQRSDYAREPD